MYETYIDSEIVADNLDTFIYLFHVTGLICLHICRIAAWLITPGFYNKRLSYEIKVTNENGWHKTHSVVIG
jgi:hypothetical protein